MKGERNHAVVPVSKFSAKFGAFFGSALLSPIPTVGLPAAAWQEASMLPTASLRAFARACITVASAGWRPLRRMLPLLDALEQRDAGSVSPT